MNFLQIPRLDPRNCALTQAIIMLLPCRQNNSAEVWFKSGVWWWPPAMIRCKKWLTIKIKSVIFLCSHWGATIKVLIMVLWTTDLGQDHWVEALTQMSFPRFYLNYHISSWSCVNWKSRLHLNTLKLKHWCMLCLNTDYLPMLYFQK